MNRKITSVTVGLPVTQLDQAIEWYRQLLGKLEEISPTEGIWEAQVTPSFWIQLFEHEPDTASSKVVNFETEDIELSHKLALSLGVEVGEIETVPQTVRFFEFCDPFGNQLSFHQLLSKNA